MADNQVFHQICFKIIFCKNVKLFLSIYFHIRETSCIYCRTKEQKFRGKKIRKLKCQIHLSYRTKPSGNIRRVKCDLLNIQPELSVCNLISCILLNLLLEGRVLPCNMFPRKGPIIKLTYKRKHFSESQALLPPRESQ